MRLRKGIRAMDTNMEKGDRDYYITYLINIASENIYKTRKNELQKYNISPRQSVCLNAIQALGGGPTPADIARYMIREHNTILVMLDRMEKDGLIKKSEDPRRKNTYTISMTEKGIRAYNDSLARESLHEIMSSLSHEEGNLLKSCLEKIIEAAFKRLDKDKRPTFYS